MEFAAGISVGLLVGLIAGLVVSDWVRRNDDREPRPTYQRETHTALYLPPPAEQPSPFPYQPQVIVLAAPRERTNDVVSVERPTTHLARR